MSGAQFKYGKFEIEIPTLWMVVFFVLLNTTYLIFSGQVKPMEIFNLGKQKAMEMRMQE